ncbi:uncharacterized protein LOC130430241 [Triplophysa dalaica]|uniref:uncharacterized protein LOC130430241 n=1 Tax=Triplophysa dalaica TaxID=1582913 RepID=UPI0024DFAAA2|nr:uncharacterized protein LOC130430241 [Triplophysa dalaica]
MLICSVFLCLSFLTACGVFSVDADEVKSVSVMEGDSVTLHTNVVKQRDDKIAWSYGPNNTFVARMNGVASSNMLSDDERFIGRLKMNNQTGDLIITHITSQHSGLYKLKISINKKNSNKKFNLTVYTRDIINSINKQDQDLTTDASPKSSDSPRMWVIIIPVVVALVICMIIIIIIIKHRRMSYKESVLKTIYAPVSDKGSSIYSSSSEDSNSSTSPNEREKKPMQLY